MCISLICHCDSQFPGGASAYMVGKGKLSVGRPGARGMGWPEAAVVR